MYLLWGKYVYSLWGKFDFIPLINPTSLYFLTVFSTSGIFTVYAGIENYLIAMASCLGRGICRLKGDTIYYGHYLDFYPCNCLIAGPDVDTG